MEFQNEFKDKRSGFSHISRLFNNGVLLGQDKRDYLNRTWEEYPYQSAMKGAVQNAIENEIEREKYDRGIKRLSQKLRREILDSSELIKELTNLKNTL